MTADDDRHPRISPGLGFNLDCIENPLLARGYKFSYNYSSHGMTLEQARTCVAMLIENDIQCEMWGNLIYFQDEYGLNVMKMVM